MPDAPKQVLEAGWLLEIFETIGLDPHRAGLAAEAARRRLACWSPTARRPAGEGLTRFFSKDPQASFRRITGIPGGALPFHDQEDGRLSVVELTSVLVEIGLDDDVALAFAKVVAEAYEPEELFQPVWEALGRRGPVDLGVLRGLDWSPLRAILAEPDSTVVTTVARPRPQATVAQAGPAGTDRIRVSAELQRRAPSATDRARPRLPTASGPAKKPK